MSGLYIHIPFCKKACHYCDFHFSTSLKYRKEIVDAICLELKQQNNFLKNPLLESIYFGGGTPSILTKLELEQIFNSINKNFQVEKNAEITIEANPDDLNTNKIKELRDLPFNRFSLGVQSFDDKILNSLNRSHTTKQTLESYKELNDHGYNNISLDLILASHLSTEQTFENDILQISKLAPNHISTYILTIEEKTTFGNWLKKNKIKEIDDIKAERQYSTTIQTLESLGYEHYEISNFAKPNKRAIHNSNYWLNKPYLGIGPSAHSYDENHRYFNIANNASYIKAINNNTQVRTCEKLNHNEKTNETIMISLRTWQGLNLNKLNLTPESENEMKSILSHYISIRAIEIRHNAYHLTTSGKMISDGIIEDLFQ